MFRETFAKIAVLCLRLSQVTKTESCGTSETPRTRGELEQLHGVAETAELLQKGFFDKIMIKGVEHFVKIGFEKKQSLSKSVHEEMELKKSVGSDEISQLESGFESFQCALDLDWKSGWKNVPSSGAKDFDLPSAGCSSDSKVSPTFSVCKTQD